MISYWSVNDRLCDLCLFFFFKQKTAYEMRISDWSSDVCSSDLGGLHRNTFINSPRLLDDRLRLKAVPRISFAGQITGCEGYVESAAVGLMAGRFAAAEVLGRSIAPPPVTTALGPRPHHIPARAPHQTSPPVNVNFGPFPPPHA